MLGLHKAFCVLLLCLPLVTCARWDWSESVFHLGNWWRKHFDTDYWCLVDGDGELMHEEDVDWYVSHGYDLPWLEQGCRRYRGRKAPSIWVCTPGCARRCGCRCGARCDTTALCRQPCNRASVEFTQLSVEDLSGELVGFHFVLVCGQASPFIPIRAGDILPDAQPPDGPSE